MKKLSENKQSEKPYKPSVYEISWYMFLFVVFSLVMKYSQDLFLPLVVSFILYFCFCPVVDKLETLKIKRWISSVAIILTLFSIVFTGVYYLSGPLYQLTQNSGKRLSNIEKKFIFLKKPMQKISEAQEKVNQITDLDNSEPVKVQLKEVSIGERFFYQARLLTLNTFASFVVFFFLLLYGDALFCKLGAVLPYGGGSDFDEDSLLSKIQSETCFYLLAITLINSVLGLAIGGALYLLNFPNPFLWGAVAGLLNFIPYIGGLIGVSSVLLLSLSGTGTNLEIIAPAFAYFAINTLEGQFLTPMILGRAFRLNPLIILLSLIYWGFIWGVAGLFVAIPILIVLEVIGDNSVHLKGWTAALKL